MFFFFVFKNHLTKRSTRGNEWLSINYTVIGYRAARLCRWTGPIRSPFFSFFPPIQSAGTSREGFEYLSTIIIAARVMYHVIVHADSGVCICPGGCYLPIRGPGLVRLLYQLVRQREPIISTVRIKATRQTGRCSMPRRKFHKSASWRPGLKRSLLWEDQAECRGGKWE